MEIEKLNWDSDFFGMKIGRIIINDNTKFDSTFFLEKVKIDNYDLVYLLKYNDTFTRNEILLSGIELMDIQVTMSLKFNKESFLMYPFELKTILTIHEIKQCYQIAEEVSLVSRFYKEETIGINKTRELYRKWIDNSLNQTHSDGLFLLTESDSIIGLHIIRTDSMNKIGYFTLTGVSKNYTRRGFGKKLWLSSLGYWANMSDIKIVKSSFSFKNIASFNFHINMGFTKIEEMKYIYHYRRPKM